MLRIERLPITDPDAARLVEEVQQEYVRRYGGRDESPVDVNEFLPPAGEFFVGYLDHVAVATGAWRWIEQGEPVIEVKRMYVVPAHRGAGHARAMLAHIEQRGREVGSPRVILQTGSLQPEAIALYESSGYLPIPGFGHYGGHPGARAFAKALESLEAPADSA